MQVARVKNAKGVVAGVVAGVDAGVAARRKTKRQVREAKAEPKPNQRLTTSLANPKNPSGKAGAETTSPKRPSKNRAASPQKDVAIAVVTGANEANRRRSSLARTSFPHSFCAVSTSRHN